MNSACLIEFAAPVAATQSAQAAALRDEDFSSEKFGTVLDELTAQQDDENDTEVEDAAVDSETHRAEKKKEPELLVLAPLICICPPPVTAPLQPPPVAATPKAEADPVKTSEVSAAVASPPPGAPSANGDDKLVDTVRPKGAETKPEKSIAPTASELDPAVFEAVTEPPKQPPREAATATNAAHGTLVAKLEDRVKNSGKSAENAAAIEQKMPVRPLSRRALAEVSRLASFSPLKDQSHALTADFQAEQPPEVIAVKSIEAAHLVETIRTEVTQLRQRGDVALSVVLKPDGATQLTVDISISRDGVVHAQARCERGDFHTLNTQWPQLQQSLAAHGIRMTDLSNHNNSQQQQQPSPGALENFDRGQNQQQQNPRDLATFEEQFVKRVPANPAKPQPPIIKPASATRHWQSWA